MNIQLLVLHLQLYKVQKIVSVWLLVQTENDGTADTVKKKFSHNVTFVCVGPLEMHIFITQNNNNNSNNNKMSTTIATIATISINFTKSTLLLAWIVSIQQVQNHWKQ